MNTYYYSNHYIYTDDLVLMHHGINKYSAEYANMCFQLFIDWKWNIFHIMECITKYVFTRVYKLCLTSKYFCWKDIDLF